MYSAAQYIYAINQRNSGRLIGSAVQFVYISIKSDSAKLIGSAILVQLCHNSDEFSNTGIVKFRNARIKKN